MKRIFGLVLLIAAIAGTVNFVRKLSAETPAQTSTSAAYDSGKKAGKFLAPIFLLVVGLAGLKMLLTADEDSPAIPPRRALGQTTVPPGHPSLRGGQATFASNAAQLHLKAGDWLVANPWVPITGGVLLGLGLLTVFFKPPLGGVLMATSAFFVWQQLREAKQKFFGGDVCPGIVLSAEQGLVAIYTDLGASGQHSYPVIQILKQPLHKMRGEPAYDGMRVATAALYVGNAQAAAWKNFWPEVINCVIHEPEEIERVLGSISDEEWQTLDVCLSQVPVATLGLHHIKNFTEAEAGGHGIESISAPESTVPWFKTKPAIIGFSVVGGILTLMFGLVLLGAFFNWKSRHDAMNPKHFSPPPMNFPHSSGDMTKAGPYSVDGNVDANWAGEWKPGKITRIMAGGRMVMVQLEDKRFPMPLALSTNQIRLK